MKTLPLSILLVEDQTALAQNIIEFLTSKEYLLDYATNGQHGLSLALKNHYDVIILDLMLPKINGLQVCKLIREKASRHIPILMLTARDSLDDKMKGFQHGADDYLTKPFALKELSIRCLALSRRHLLVTDDTIKLGTLVIERKNNKAYREGIELSLSTICYNILLILAEASPRIITRSELYARIWGDDPIESDTLRSHIYQLRKILDIPYTSSMLKTMHGIGFSIVHE